MPRVARIVVPGISHHVVQRGNNQQDVFFVDNDREVYLSYLLDESEKHGLSILGYCLMTNHIHLVATPREEDSLARAVGRTHYRYSQYVNRFHGRSGHLWQNRFFSCALDLVHLLAVLKYVDCNPVRAKLVRRPWRYPWSSAEAHCSGSDNTNLLDMKQWKKRLGDWDWKDYLMKPESDEKLEEFRLSTRVGRPLGSDSFLSKLETKLGRRLRPLPIGRPRKRREQK